MTPDQIHRTRGQYTDKYVVVDAQQPELARFEGFVGLVKTINMNGRALVEFLDCHRNVGWYDIALDFLRVVDKPAATRAEAQERAKPSAKKPSTAAGPETPAKKLSPLEMARLQGAAKKPTAAQPKAGKKSVADVLAAARGKKGDGPAAAAADQQAGKTPLELARMQGAAKKPATAEPKAGKKSVADILAAARGEKDDGPAAAAADQQAGKTPLELARMQGAAKKPATAEPKAGKKSVADILAAARAEKRGGPAPDVADQQAKQEPVDPSPTADSAVTSTGSDTPTDAAKAQAKPTSADPPTADKPTPNAKNDTID